MSRRAVAILISGGGSNMLALARDMADPAHPAEVALVISNRPAAPGLARAAEMGLPVATVDHRAHPDRERFEAAVQARLEAAGTEIVCLAGFMRVLTGGFVARWAGRMLNVHPSLLPLFPGVDTHARALAAGVSVHGCTVHEVTPELDAGPILGQAVVPVRAGDTAETLAARLRPMEHRLYPLVLRRFAADDRGPTALFP